jgi:succinate dehydrogenase/fumarate reductase flavoprotein subunit
MVRAFADNNVETYEFLTANGVRFSDDRPTYIGAATVERRLQIVGATGGLRHSVNGSPGSGLVRALESSAKAKGVTFLLRHRMMTITRLPTQPGQVAGITADAMGSTVTLKTRRGVVIATGGCSSNVELRRIFDPRLTEEYQTAGEPFSLQNGDGEMAALKVGAALWGTAVQTNEAGVALAKTQHIGCRWGYPYLKWNPASPIFGRARASGLTVSDWRDLILTNQLGHRFWNECDDSYDFFAACMGSAVVDDGRTRLGGPIWAIFDAAAVEREGWVPNPPHVDTGLFFFKADSLLGLCSELRANPYQKVAMEPSVLEHTVARYNKFVEQGSDLDFKKPGLRFKISRPPFFAAWATPMVHDTLTGLRTNATQQVLDWTGNVIPGLYCVGESAGGLGLHGLARCVVGGYVAGREAALAPVLAEMT